MMKKTVPITYLEGDTGKDVLKDNLECAGGTCPVK